jgi:hypothetical protein
VTPDFSLGLTSQPRDKALANFDTFWKAKGIEVEKLSDDDRAAYDEERASYAEGCADLYAHPEKQKALAEQHARTDRWAAKERRAGRQVWGRLGPAAPKPVATAVATPVAAGAPRDRESHGEGRREGNATSRGGDSGDRPRSSSDDDDESQPPDVARPDRRASRRGGAR